MSKNNNEGKVKKVAKQVILGKEKPPFLLRTVCSITFTWSGIMMLFLSLSGLVAFISGKDLFDIEMFQGTTPKLFLSYAALHFLMILGAVLMWRLNKSGFYLYTFASITTLVFLYLNFLHFDDFNWKDIVVFSATLGLIALFGLHWKKFK